MIIYFFILYLFLYLSTEAGFFNIIIVGLLFKVLFVIFNFFRFKDEDFYSNLVVIVEDDLFDVSEVDVN